MSLHLSFLHLPPAPKRSSSRDSVLPLSMLEAGMSCSSEEPQQSADMTHCQSAPPSTTAASPSSSSSPPSSLSSEIPPHILDALRTRFGSAAEGGSAAAPASSASSARQQHDQEKDKKQKAATMKRENHDRHWSMECDVSLCSLYHLLGGRWSFISKLCARHLGWDASRDRKSCRGRWQRLQKVGFWTLWKNGAATEKLSAVRPKTRIRGGANAGVNAAAGSSVTLNVVGSASADATAASTAAATTAVTTTATTTMPTTIATTPKTTTAAATKAPTTTSTTTTTAAAEATATDAVEADADDSFATPNHELGSLTNTTEQGELDNLALHPTICTFPPSLMSSMIRRHTRLSSSTYAAVYTSKVLEIICESVIVQAARAKDGANIQVKDIGKAVGKEGLGFFK